MNDLLQPLSIFLPNYLPETKDPGKDKKAYDRARDACQKTNVYDLQLKCCYIIKQIDISKLLGINDVILPLIVQEYADLYIAMQQLKKVLQSIKGTVPNIAMIDDYLKLSQLKENLWKDLNFLADVKKISFDVKIYMESYSKLSQGK